MDIREMVKRKNQPQTALLGRGGKMGSNPKFAPLTKLIVKAIALNQQAQTALGQLQNRADVVNKERAARDISEQLQVDLSALKADYLNQLQAMRTDAFNETFSLSANANAMEKRDALKTAMAVTNEKEGQHAYWLAKQTGDVSLISAYAYQAHRQSWRAILKDFFGSYSEAQTSWMMFEEISAELDSAEGKLRSAAYFRSSVASHGSGSWTDGQGSAPQG